MSQDLQHRAEAALTEHKTHRAAAAALGISPRTLRRWLSGTTPAQERAAARSLYRAAPAPREQAHWSDFSWEGWEREAGPDRHEKRVRILPSGEEDTYAVRVVDPGVQYPPRWDGPRLDERRRFRVRQADGARRWILTACQDKTPLHGPLMVNLEAYAAFVGAEILVGGFTYAKDWYGAIFGDQRGEEKVELGAYPSYLADRIQSRRLDVGGPLYCAEVNILPTAVSPLSGLQTYGKGRTVIFSHPKQHLESLPRAPHLDPVTAWTTGACTPPNYVQRKAGLKARFHHVLGAVIVEQDVDGAVFIRHIHADAATGSFQDLDVRVDRGEIETGCRVRAISYGDVHAEHLDPVSAASTWYGPGALQQVLRPAAVFVHDVLDFFTRNHHNRQDPWHAARVHKSGRTVAQEIRHVAAFLASIRQAGTQVHVVESNHDLALSRWVREADWRADPVNGTLQLELALDQARAIDAGESISLFETAVRRLSDDGLADVRFLREDESCLVDGVECGWHGHNGPNGSKGTSRGYLRTASKIAKGHDHTPTRIDGVCSSGTKQRRDPMPAWAKGPSSWADADVVIYDGGRMTHVFHARGRWRAEGRRRAAAIAA
ncbi:helix-turn-helix domain-containing protein [Salinarimonas rosea]|uniref:helix-turn-helix domain-containing protein n=1 Tax=Salinarimonas rosea TaxID=552063 RepID=UPI0003F92B82|nr:helix-turn-helix domain-containing protein [Salinarimonas rosea]